MKRNAAARFLFFVVIVGLPAATAWAQTVSMATIRGTVISSEGKPIPRAVLAYGRAAPANPKATAAILGPVLTARTAADGSFTLADLAPGSWLVCVDAPGHLDPCHWSFAPTLFTVAAGQVTRNAVVRLDPAYTLHIQIKDPQRLLANERGAAGGNLQIGVRAPSGAFQPAILSSNIPGERDYAVTVPARSPARVLVSGGSFQLNDALAAPVPPTGRMTEVAAPDPSKPAIGSASPLSFTITSIGRP